MILHQRSSVQKKPNYKFLHAGRFRESEINFVFCEWELYNGTAPEQKTESAKNSLDIESKLFFTIPLSATSCTHLPLQGRLKGLFILFGALQPLYRQSKPLMKNIISGLFLYLFGIICSVMQEIYISIEKICQNNKCFGWGNTLARFIL